MTYLVLIFIAMVAQTLFVYRQYLTVRNHVAAIKKEYPIVSVGASRGLLNRSAVLAVDHDGIVRKAFVLSGFTIFARLREVAFLSGKTYGQVGELCRKDKKMRCVAAAATFVQRHFDNHCNREENHD